MQNESSVNKKVLRYFENTNKQIVAYAGFLSFRVWFLISVLLLIVLGNGLLLFISMHASSSISPARSSSISFDRGSVTATVREEHTASQQQNSSISLPHISVVPTMQAAPKDGVFCAGFSRCTRITDC